jgi:hypothetical protein
LRLPSPAERAREGRLQHMWEGQNVVARDGMTMLRRRVGACSQS